MKKLLIIICISWQALAVANNATFYTVVCSDEKNEPIVAMVYDYCISWMGPTELKISGEEVSNFYMDFQTDKTQFYSDNTEEVVFDFSIPVGDQQSWSMLVELGAKSVSTVCHMTDAVHACE